MRFSKATRSPLEIEDSTIQKSQYNRELEGLGVCFDLRLGMQIGEIREILTHLNFLMVERKSVESVAKNLTAKSAKQAQRTQSYIYLTRWLKLVFNDNFTSVRVIFERKSYREQVKFH